MHVPATIAKLTLAILAIAGVAIAQNSARATPPPASAPATAQPTAHALPASSSDDLVVGLCDGTTSVEVKGKKAGEPLSPAEARKVAEDLMNQWKQKNPKDGSSWERENLLAQSTPQPGGNRGGAAHGAATPTTSAQPGAVTVSPRAASKLQDGHTYGAYTTRDEQIWRASTESFVEEGNKIFHDAKAMGGTIAVSCDMCHPNAANTHPETYPKFQVQLGRVAMLRDMINWCIENPVRGKPLSEEDPRMKAMEAYIFAQRKGVPLEYGKH